MHSNAARVYALQFGWNSVHDRSAVFLLTWTSMRTLPLSSFPLLGVEKRDRKMDTEGATSVWKAQEGEIIGKDEDKNVNGGFSQA